MTGQLFYRSSASALERVADVDEIIHMAMLLAERFADVSLDSGFSKRTGKRMSVM